MHILSYIFHPRASLRLFSDRLRTRVLRTAPAVLRLMRKSSFAMGAETVGLHILMAEHRLSGGTELTAEVRKRLPQVMAHLKILVFPIDISRVPRNRAFRAIVLQAPVVEADRIYKGVLLIKFTETFRFFYHHVDVAKLLRYFRVVLEPSWSGYCLPEILFWSQYGQPVVVEASELTDRRFLEELGTTLVPISVGASDWVDHRVFRPLGVERDIDVIYIANLSPIKRVHVYLRALGEIVARRGSIRAALVLSSWGGNKATFDDLLDLYSLRDQVSVFMNLSQPELNGLLNRAKLSVLLSKKEGSNKTLFESMFAGTPVLLIEDNIGVNKDYINQHTGVLVAERDLPAAIERFMDGSPVPSPRTWAMENIAPELTTRKLEGLLNRLYIRDDIASAPLWVKVNAPEATYMDPAVAQQMPHIADTLDCFSRYTEEGKTEEATHARMSALYGYDALKAVLQR
jgi:glycosyltransferase involved in cell wall biosynthesis